MFNLVLCVTLLSAGVGCVAQGAVSDTRWLVFVGGLMLGTYATLMHKEARRARD